MDDSENKQARTKTGLCLSSEAAGGVASPLPPTPAVVPSSTRWTNCRPWPLLGSLSLYAMSKSRFAEDMFKMHQL